MENKIVSSLSKLIHLDTKFFIQFFTFLIIVLVLDTLEQRKPGYLIDKNKELGLNILAFVIVIFAPDYLKWFVMSGLNVFHLDKLATQNWFGKLPGGIKMIMAIVLYDFVLYWVHRVMHTRVLWPTHSFHHTIAEIWWLAGTRASFFHLFLFAFAQVLVGYYLFQLSNVQLGITLAFQILVNLWIHANLWVNIGPVGKIFITPNFHRIHHGAKGLTNKNLGFVFTFWDRMFGTFVDPDKLGRSFTLFPVKTQNRLIRMLIGV